MNFFNFSSEISILLLQISVDHVPDTFHGTLILKHIEDRIDRDSLAVDEIISPRDHVFIVSSVNRSATNRESGVDRVLTVREKKALLLIKFKNPDLHTVGKNGVNQVN